jgi:hypothetical protein
LSKTFSRGIISAHQHISTSDTPGVIDRTSILSSLDGLEMVAGNATHEVDHGKIDEVMGSWLTAVLRMVNGATLWQCFFFGTEDAFGVSKTRVERWV